MRKIIFDQIKDAVSILRLDKAKMIEVAGRKSATIWGIAIVFIPPVVNLILSALKFPTGFGVIFTRFLLWPIFIPALSMLGSIFLMTFLAQRIFHGHGNHLEFFRPVAYASIILWISIIPFLLAFFGIIDPIGLYNLIWIIAMIWMLVVAYQMLIFYHKLHQTDALIVIGLAIGGYFVLRWGLGRILVGKAYRIWY